MSTKEILSKITNCACYIRRSRQDMEREKRTGEDTLAAQRQIMEKTLSDLKVPYFVYSEIGSGDKIETRPVFQQLLKELQSGIYNAVAVREISRLGRGSFADNGIIYDLFTQGLYIITPYRIYDPANPSDCRMVRFELFFSREEFEMIKERLTSARYTYAAEGRWVTGSVPYGYRLNNKKGKLEIHEDEAEVVRFIFNAFVYGLEVKGKIKDVSYQSIATYLSKVMGIPSPRHVACWNMLTVKRILNNPAYVGTLIYRKTKRAGGKVIYRPSDEWIVHENAHEPIIERELWDKAQEKIKRSKKGPSLKLDFLPCELAALVRCGRCGRRMVRQYQAQHYHKKSGGESVYRKEFLWCKTYGCTFVKYRDVEEKILRFLEEIKEIDFDVLIEKYRETYQQQKKNKYDAGKISELVTDRIGDLKRRLQFICQKYEEGIYDDETFLMRKKEIENELNRLKSIDLQNDNGNEETEDDLESVIKKYKGKVISYLEAYKLAEHKTTKNNLLHAIIDEIILTKTDKGKFDLHIIPKILV